MVSIRFVNETDYYASSFAEFMSRVINDGYLQGIANEFAIVEESPKTLDVEVDTGEAFLTGRNIINDAKFPLVFSAGDATYGRIDLIILELDIINETAEFKILQGTPGAVPVEPTLTRTSAIMQYALRSVPIAAGASAVDMALATNTMDNPNYFGMAAPLSGQYQKIIDITVPDLNKVVSIGAAGVQLKYLNTVQIGNELLYLFSGSSKKMNLSTYVVSNLTNCAGAIVEATYFGGFVYGFLSSKRYKYSVTGDSWTDAAISANDSSVRRIAESGGKFYSFANAYNKVVEIDLGANTYTQKAALPAGTVTSLPIASNGKIYFVIDGKSTTAGKIYEYDIAGNSFAKLYEGKLYRGSYGDDFQQLKIVANTLFILGLFSFASFALGGTSINILYSASMVPSSGAIYTWLHPYGITGLAWTTVFNASGAGAYWLSDGRMYCTVSTNNIIATPFYPLGVANKTQIIAYRQKTHPEIGVINLTTGAANDDATALETGDEYGMYTAFPEEVLTGKVTLYG